MALEGASETSTSRAGADPRRTQSASALAPVQIQQQQLLPRSPSAATEASHSSKAGAAPSTMLAAMGRSSSSFLTLSSNFFMGAALKDDKTTVLPVTIVYDAPGPLFVDLFSRPDGKGAYVKAFRRTADGAMGAAEASGRIHVNDELYAINGCVVTDLLFSSIIQAAKTATFPLTLLFHTRVVVDPPEPLVVPVLTRKTSQLPPASPARGGRTSSFSSEWTAKLGQMIADSGMKRSSSFDKKLEKQSASSPTSTRTSSSGDTPTGLTTPGKLKQTWGDGLTLDKMKHSGSDGMKNLLRMIGGKARPEEDRETVSMWFDQLLLRPDSSVLAELDTGHAVNSLVHSTPVVVVTAGGRLLGVRDDDAGEFAVAWYRKTVENDLVLIKGATSGRYFPSVDDVGATLSAHVTSLRFAPLARVVEFPRRLQIDPAVGELVDVLLDAGAGSFSATLASNEFDSFQVKITAARVTLVKVAEDDDDAGVVADTPYDAHVQVLLDPTDQCRFALKVREFGPFIGNRRGDTCRLARPSQRREPPATSDYACVFLVAQNPQHRDILALLIRKFRARVLPPELEAQAHRDEITLFLDPVFACATLSTGSSSSVSPSASAGIASSVTTAAAALSAPGTTSRSSLSSPSDAAQTTRRSTSGASQSVSAQLTDVFGLHDGEESDESDGAGLVHAPAHAASSPPDAFLQSRFAAQEREIATLQDKLSSLTALLQSIEHEKEQIRASVEVKDKRIELQQSKLQALEKLTAHHSAQTRELQTLRLKLDDDECARLALQQQLDDALARLGAVTQTAPCECATQTDEQTQAATASTAQVGWTADDIASQLSPRSINFEMDLMAKTVATLEAQLAAQREAFTKLESDHSAVVTERNAFRAKTTELGRELRKLVTASRSLADIETQLAERSALATQLAVAKAEAKRASDESKEFKDALECVLKQRGMGDKDKDTQRVLSQNLDLQRVVHQLTDSLNESKEQMTALQKINSALMDRLHVLQPDARGSILFESPLNSPSSVASARAHPTFSDDDESDDDDSDGSDSDDEGFTGSAVTGVITQSL